MKYLRVKCDQCEALVLNGTACHETGCIRSRYPWVTSQDGKYRVPAIDFDESEYAIREENYE